MKKSIWRATQKNREIRQSMAVLLAVVVFVIAGVYIFIKLYNSYIDTTLYAERLNQMREVTTQLFSGLEDIVKNEWRTVGTQNRMIQENQPETVDDMVAFMADQAALADLAAIQCNLVAVDENGSYYTQEGRQGLMPEREYLTAEPEQVSYVSNSLTYNETRMVFLQHLSEPIIMQDGTDTVTLCYYGISQNMEELNPYFECSAYSGHSSVYVVDDTGLKLFSSSNSGDFLKGFNVFSALSNMEYLHGSTFDSTYEEFSKQHIAYSNALWGNTELYYCLYQMDHSAWTLIFLVPSEYVAMNTVNLVHITMRLVMVFAIVMVLISACSILWLSHRQQKVALDVERRNNAKLEQLNGELVAASKAKSNFLANMSHDIRTPMNAIVGIVSLLEHEKDLTDKQYTYLQKIQLSSQHLLSLINDVLDMSKIEANEVAMNMEPISLADQVGQVESIVRPQTDEQGQEFVIRVHEVAHEYLTGDSVRLRQIFINLLSNAVKYTPYGGKVILDLAELPCEIKDHATIRVTVTDNGYGMSRDFVEHIFEPFTRAEDSTTNKVQGTGLGMAITKNIVDLMGGTITVQSEVNQGSCFEVTLTFPIDHSMEHTVYAKGVLLIADEEVLIHNIHASMTEANVPFYTASTIDGALGQIRSQRADVILLAGYLHDQKLSENIRLLRDAAADSILIFCCDYVQEDQLHDLVRESGADGLIARPFFLSKLIHMLDHVRNDHTTEDEGRSVLSGMRFLCAEDNELNAEILEAVLEMNDASCVIYPDGEKLVKAFETVKPGDYDMILMDVQMPRMNGLQAARAIRSGANPLGRTIPIIAMTANAFAEDVQTCLDAGMNAHVAKPLDVTALERAVRGRTTPPPRVLKPQTSVRI